MPVAIYLRSATFRRSDEEDSLRAQRNAISAYCDRHRLNVFREYEDNGVGGYEPLASRPEGSRLMSDASERKFDKLLVCTLDRLGRSATDVVRAVEHFERLGITVEAVSQPGAVAFISNSELAG
ncbi:MAG: recombinase family protein [Acidobacteria bacterium]|nr:recombinase family protein [Acidobacteriota bacterium]